MMIWMALTLALTDNPDEWTARMAPCADGQQNQVPRTILCRSVRFLHCILTLWIQPQSWTFTGRVDEQGGALQVSDKASP